MLLATEIITHTSMKREREEDGVLSSPSDDGLLPIAGAVPAGVPDLTNTARIGPVDLLVRPSHLTQLFDLLDVGGIDRCECSHQGADRNLQWWTVTLAGGPAAVMALIRGMDGGWVNGRQVRVIPV